MGVVYIVISINFDKHKVPIVIPFRSKEGAQECAGYIKESHPECTTFIKPAGIAYGFERGLEHKPREKMKGNTMRHWTDEETGIPMCEPDCCDEWLEFIWMIGCDYDGCKSVEEFKALVDELVEMSQKARDCLHDGFLFSNTTSGCVQQVKHELRKLIAEIPLLRWCVGNCKCEEHEGRNK